MKECRRSKAQLMQLINEVSFAVNDMNLYLDTHPDDKCAMEFMTDKIRIREEALKEYAMYYGPLTIATADDDCSTSWDWVMQPWPWEQKGGSQSMWNYEKRLQYPINIKTPNAKAALFIMSQYGGPECNNL